MKNTLKLIGGIIVGALIGVGIVCLWIAFFSDISLQEFGKKIMKMEVLETIGVLLTPMISVVLAFYLQIILHEGGHLVCGLVSGYRFVSFRIMSFTFLRIDGKMRIKRYSLAGTGGQCLLAPPDRELKDIPVVLYNLGGVLANLLTSILALLPFYFVDTMPYPVRVFLLLFALVGLMLGLLNGIPMKMGGVSNDAHNLLQLKHEGSKKAIVTQLRVNALVQEGMRPKDMPEEWFVVEGEVDYGNSLQAAIRLMYFSRLLDMEEWEAAHRGFEEILAHRSEIMGLFVKETECELLFTSLVTGRLERAEALYDQTLSLYIEQHKAVMSSKQRILCALALYRDQDRDKALEIYEEVCRKKPNYLMHGEVDSDIAMMHSILFAVES